MPSDVSPWQENVVAQAAKDQGRTRAIDPVAPELNERPYRRPSPPRRRLHSTEFWLCAWAEAREVVNTAAIYQQDCRSQRETSVA